MPDPLTCNYVSPDGLSCSESVPTEGLCFWHNPDVSKEGIHLSEKLEAYAARGGIMHGMQLRRSNLDNVNLVNHKPPYFYDLSYSDLYRCNLNSAHMFNLKLVNGSLMKANLSRSNLHCANLTNTNLLGVILKGARTDNLEIGNELIQEKQAAVIKTDPKKQTDYYEQAEEIYRTLRNNSEAQGLSTVSGHCLHKEMTMRRYQMPLFSNQRLTSKMVDIFCGYGEKPLHIISFSMMLILVFAFAYFSSGLLYNDELIKFSSDLSVKENLTHFFSALYFSVVTFTTLGYGDITPIGPSRTLAAVEAFSGSFTIAMFVVVFVKRMHR